jgi:hypothetical protein
MLRALEITWLVVAVVSMLLGIYISIAKGFGEGYVFYIFTAIGSLMYYVRRKQRISWGQRKNDTSQIN